MNEPEQKLFDAVKNRKDDDARIAVGLFCPLDPGVPDNPDDEIPNLDIQDENGFTLLHYAVKRGLERTVLRLLEKGASVEASDSSGTTPLIAATQMLSMGSDSKFYTSLDVPLILKTLLEHGATISSVDKFGRNCLQMAVTINRLDVVDYLLNHRKMDPNIKSPTSGMTALHYVALDNRAEMVALLLRAGANLEIVDNSNRTPIMVAKKMKHQATVDALEQKATPPVPHLGIAASSSEHKTSLAAASSLTLFAHKPPLPIHPWIVVNNDPQCTHLRLDGLELILKKDRDNVGLNVILHDRKIGIVVDEEDLENISRYLNEKNIETLTTTLESWGHTGQKMGELVREGIREYEAIHKKDSPGL